jgi:hypothetical protein
VTSENSHEAVEAKGATVLKGHGFSRANCEFQKVLALAAEGCFWAISIIPSGAKAQGLMLLRGTLRQAQGRLQVVPSQST